MIKAKQVKPVKKKLDSVFSEYIRRKYSDKDGIVQCVTCGRKSHWKKMQCGHYIKRSHMATRWSEENCYPQCVGCNMFQNGNYPKFTEWLIKNKGEKFLKKLLEKQHIIIKMTPYDMQLLMEFYRGKLEDFK